MTAPRDRNPSGQDDRRVHYGLGVDRGWGYGRAWGLRGTNSP